MLFRDVLAVLRTYPAGVSTATAVSAADFAAVLASHASAIACAIKPRVPRSILGDALINVSAMVGEEYKRSKEDAERLLSAFEKAATKRGAFGQRIFVSCRPFEVPDVLADYSRLRDLTILPLPEDVDIPEVDAQWYAEAVIFGSGHPSVVLPRDAKDPFALETVIVAWDKSRVAARTVADALPILKQAKHVRLLTVTGEKEIASRQSTSDFTQHLSLHDVNVVTDEVHAGGRAIGSVLQDQVAKYSADLLVMGAYGHSRMREFILGGATKSMLAHPPTAVFLSH
jgi:nucleotide-binding universal stress UspA family protein